MSKIFNKNKHDPAKWDTIDAQIEQLLCEHDENSVPLPDIEFEPHLLISKVRKHYMEYIIRLLSHNYETNQMLLNKNIYLPSAIWRCAKNIETKAAQMCMVVQLYRNHVTSVINEVKTDTKMGRLNKRLYECLHRPALNEKKIQTTSVDTNVCCHCDNSNSKRRRKKSSPKTQEEIPQGHIPVVINMQINQAPIPPTPTNEGLVPNHPEPPNSAAPKNLLTKPDDSDDLMMQLEKLFQSDEKEDDLFEGLDNFDTTDDSKKMQDLTIILEDSNSNSNINKAQDSIIEEHAEKIKSLNQRIETLAGMLENQETSHVPQPQPVAKKKERRRYASKWHCEEYFMKKDLFEMMYQIGDTNRKKLLRIKEKYLKLFGEDSDDEEGVISPITETTEFIESCKSRISAWVVTTLNPYYAKGRIRGKALYKSVAKHLIELIYKCKPYPSKYEVTSFVLDFLENHDMIRCEADFKEFKIENVNLVRSYNLV